MIDSPNAHSGLGSAKLKLGVKDATQVSDVICRDPAPEPSPALPLRVCIRGMLELGAYPGLRPRHF